MSFLLAENLSFSNENKEILKNLTLSIEQGDFISIIGHSGSGKSTLLKIIADLIPYSSGSLYYKNKNYNDYIPTELRKKIVYCFQQPYLFGNTIEDNFNFVYNLRNEKINLKRIKYLFKIFQLDDKNLKDNVSNLSGGEVQRIALIRSLLFLPEILLLDEVTSALDINNKNIVNNAIKEINNQGVTILYVTHDFSEIKKYANKLLTLEKGNILSLEVIK